MSPLRTSSPAEGLALRIDRFGRPPTQPRRRAVRRPGRRALVRVTHASVGVTDVMAVRGDYLLHPVPGFVAGYDLVGTVERLPPGERSGLTVGQRVAAILPGMGAHASLVAVAPSLLVAVPDALDSATAATVPLDAVTARFALDAAGPGGGSVLVQGGGGAVGAWAAQLARADGRTVYATASSRSRRYAESLGAAVLDYRDPGWIDDLVARTGGGVTAAIDQTGGRAVRRAVRADGCVVRIAFGGAPGRQRRATAFGFAAAGLRRFAHPRERVCSVPMIVATRRAAYRRTLVAMLDALARGDLSAPEPRVFGLADYAEALSAAEGSAPGTKVVLTAG